MMDPERFGSFNSSELKNEQPKDADGKDIPVNGYQHKIYKVNNYVINRYKNDKCFKCSILIGGVSTLLLLIMIFVGVFHLNKTGIDETNESKDFEELVLAGKNGLLSFDQQSKKAKDLIFSFQPGYDAYEAYGRDKFFWSNPNDSTINYYSTDMLPHAEGNLFHTLLEEPRVKPQDMAYDHIGHNLYVIDKSAGTLIVINVETKEYDILMTDLIRPHHIELDPHHGLLFILQQSHSILRGNMDGRSMVNIIQSEEITAMAIDRKNKRIYWVNSVKGIESSDYYGKDLERYPVETLNVVDLAVVNNELYWLLPEERDDKTIHHILSCKIEDEICEEQPQQAFEYLGDFTSMRVTHSYPEDDSKNPCRSRNGGCQHICLIAPGGKNSCACNLGWQLGLNKKSCSQVQEFLLYTMSNFFRGRILDTGRNVSVDVIWPTPYENKHENEAISFDYDQVHDRIFYSDSKNIYTTRLRSNWTKEALVLAGDNTTSIKDIAHDWTTGNLYYLQDKPKDGFKLQVMNLKLGSEFNRTLINYPEDKDDANSTGIADATPPSRFVYSQDRIRAHSLTYQSNLGYLYFVYTGNYQSHQGYVVKVAANGTELTRISNDFDSVFNKKTITTDQIGQRLYWVQDLYPGRIKNSKLDGKDVKDIKINDNLSPMRSISVHRKWMYISTPEGIWRVQKKNGETKVRIAPILEESSGRGRGIGNMKIVSYTTVKPVDDHPCKDNGGCEQFCFMAESGKSGEYAASCACRDGQSVTSDRKRCMKSPYKLFRSTQGSGSIFRTTPKPKYPTRRSNSWYRHGFVN